VLIGCVPRCGDGALEAAIFERFFDETLDQYVVLDDKNAR